MAPELSIVILNWNVGGLLAACLRSLPLASSEWWGHSEVIVVDNASADGSAQMVERDFPGVRLIVMPRNIGFAAGNNRGIQAARGRYILLLNPDTVAQPGSICALADYMQEHSETGVAGPRLLNPDGTLQPSRRRFPTLATAFVESTPLQRWLGDTGPIRRFYMLDRPEGETQQVDWLSGAALLCRRGALTQVGLLDPGYFMFSEEVDLCKRMKDAGWGVVYLPDAEITHYGGGSTGQAVAARHVDFNTSKARYFRLHEGKSAGELVRRYLLATYMAQTVSEAVKWALGHKRALRVERVRMYRQVLKTGLRERRTARMKAADVLLITGEYPPAQGGVGDYTCKLGQALRSRGLRVKVLTRPAGPAPSQAGSSAGGRAETGPGPFLSSKITLRAALRALRVVRASVAHIQYQTGAYEMRPTVNLLPWLLRRAWNKPVVVTFHDLRFPYLFPHAGPLRDLVNYVMARSASAVVATNPEDAERLRSWGVRRLELIPIGSNIPNNPPAGYSRMSWRAQRDVGRDTTLLAYFGFLNSSKGLDDLLRAVKLLRGKGDFRLLMVGGGLGSSDPTNRATAARLAALAEELEISDSLLWTGYLASSEVSAALLSADMAALPYADGATFRRGSLLAVLEHGLPLVTTRLGNPHNSAFVGEWPQLADGKNALLVEPGDVGALAQAISTLAADADLRASLVAGAQQLSRFFSWSEIARRHEQLYEHLALQRGTGVAARPLSVDTAEDPRL